MNDCIAAGLGVHLFVTASRLVLEPNQPDVQWSQGLLWRYSGLSIQQTPNYEVYKKNEDISPLLHTYFWCGA
jgi:hypothetical protein